LSLTRRAKENIKRARKEKKCMQLHGFFMILTYWTCWRLFDIKWEWKVERGTRDKLQGIEGGYEGREIFKTGGPISYSTNPDNISCN